MQKLILMSSVLLLVACSGNSQNKTSKKNAMSDTVKMINRTEEEWKKILTPEQYHVLREKGTDRPFTGKYYLNKEKGVYNCAACGNELFTSDMKFDSDCGWPSFDKEIEGGKIKKQVDRTYGMIRTEIICAKCGSHLGHLFDDGPTATGQRYCVNSTSVDFNKK
ncbi:peptide-methionine (R)-S-oxide reductase [Cytophagales bacterium WSM2-2]|nr:peptide-methionine (R)-S-oxide reductase [Cytophagales bacterium WSM2-2]